MLKTLSERLKGRVFLVGIGNTLRSDDAAGPELIERLGGKVEADLLDAGEVPESYLGRITGRHPDTIVLIDAAELRAVPGTAAIIEIEDIKGKSLSSHQLGLDVFMRFLQAETGADVFLLGIQPRSTGFGEILSTEVFETIGYLEELFKKVLPAQGVVTN
ncbi:Hydrogenase 3 maturation protease [Pelotomaculum sp. FP]|uniref:hydrogenase 3 maturation endopeptidase HyCI n=1 Tax=Pelotomaculum sp. FP TaxID=261474 RepID=UPI001066E161|nr:hydrogenase 3 maturation endopeptidase HyCI [Pelotomaculum sp. FP]TEB15783.1 Hydrogenase 3 maturation protease [Pelotomaculum sp. FP]